MPGFIAEIAKKHITKNFGNSRTDGLVTGTITDGKTYTVERRTIPKFLNDKAFYENDDYIVLTEGVILNSLALQEKYIGSKESNADKLAETIIAMYQKNGEQLFSEFRGSFSGLFFDKKKDVWLIYTNHIGDKQVFYTKTEDGYAFASEVTWLTDYRKNCGLSYTLDVDGAYFLLTYAFMLEDHTLFNEIKKVSAGQYVRIERGDFSVRRYHRLDNTPNENETEEEIIERMDVLFRNAVRLEFEKDREYGYKHFASLSGGLDSRMTVWVAHELGYTEQLNYTVSQCDYLDEQIAKSIARDLKHDWMFKSLDNGNYLCGVVDEMVDLQFGNVFCGGSSHVRSFMLNFNCDEYGLHHSGQLGDAVLGTYLSTDKKDVRHNFLGAGAYSNLLLDRINNFKLADSYENSEIFKFYNRGFTGILQGNLGFQEYTEVASPFLDVDFMEYCLHIPAKYRIGEQIYMKWIIKKYPDATAYKWEKIDARITDKWVHILGRHILLKKLPKLIMRKLFRQNQLAKATGSMNPLDYWYATNPRLKSSMDRYYKTAIQNTPPHLHELKRDMETLYAGTCIEKLQVLTLLGAFKKYF